MSKLRPYLADIASAIREKKGSSEPINAKDFSNEIRSIQSGGEQPSVEEKDVNFYDYDGTLLFSYTIEEAQALTELPTPKGHEGLVFDGWNWDYGDVIALDYPMDIGALYVTDDGKTRLYLEVEDETKIELQFMSNTNITIEFGDGEVLPSQSGTLVVEHTYQKGNYVLKIDGQAYSLGTLASYRNAFGAIVSKASKILTKVELGANARVEASVFNSMSNLKTISVPKLKNNFGWTKTFYGCTNLLCVHFPPSQNYVFVNELVSTPSLKVATFPNAKITFSSGSISNSLLKQIKVSKLTLTFEINSSAIKKLDLHHLENTSFSTNAFSNNFFLVEVVEPMSAVTYAGNTYYGCCNLSEIKLNAQRTTLLVGEFYNCRSLRKLEIPSGVTSVGATCFFYCENLVYLDFSKCDSVPTLANTSAFTYTNPDTKIIVPDSLFDEWVAATNWSALANKIIKASEYVEQ